MTAAASIHHLTLNENDVGSYRTFCKLAPPLRAEGDRTALVEALASGLIDVVVSDHDPQDVETKRLPFAEAAPGAIGIETMLAASLRLVHSGDVALPALLKAMSTRPAELLDLPAAPCAPAALPTWWYSIPTPPGCSTAPTSNPNARTRRSTRRGCRAGSPAPSWRAARCTNSCEGQRTPESALWRCIRRAR